MDFSSVPRRVFIEIYVGAKKYEASGLHATVDFGVQ
jgi:hypothetical protein